MTDALAQEPENQTVITEPSSIDDELGAVFDRVHAGDDADTPEATNKGEAKPENAGRDENGRFKAKDAAIPEPEAEKTPDGEPKADTDKPEAETATAAPAHLPQAVKAAWDAMPEDARKAIVEHQTGMDRRFSEIGRQIEAARPVMDTLTQATQKFPEFQGMTPQQLAQGALSLAAVQTQLERGSAEQRAQTILQIAQQYGALPQIAAMVKGHTPDQTITALQEEIRGLRAELGKAPKYSPQDIEAQVNRSLEVRQIEDTVSSFGASKPLWSEVEQSMPQFIGLAQQMQPDATPKDWLEAAYDMAIHANPTTRQKLAEIQAAEAARKPATDTERAEKAKKAASINVKSNANGRAREMTEDEILAAVYDRVHSQ